MDNYLYSSISGIVLVVHLIINWRQMFQRPQVKSDATAVEFRRFLICLLFFFVLDILWGIFAALKCPHILYVNTILFFLMMALSVFTWTRCVIAYLGVGGWLRRYMLWTGLGVFMFFIVALIVNFFNGSFFQISAQTIYKEGPLRNIALLLLAAFNGIRAGLTLFRSLRTEGALRRRNMMVFAFGITMLVAILVQFFDPFLPIYSIGCLFGCCLLHVFVIEDERDEMYRKELLARDYEIQLEAERAAGQAKALFFSTVSHDIRTPLNAIIGYAELMEHGIEDEEERKHAFGAIVSNGHVLLDLVNDVLDLSKLDAGKTVLAPELTDFEQLASDVLHTFDVAVSGRDIDLEEDFTTIPTLMIDRHRIRQILFNLIGNAVKFTEQGEIILSARFEKNPEEDIRTGILTFSISDTGCGIPPDDLEHILEPFVQAKNSGASKGTGLGLSICQQLTKLMNGTMTVKSTLGKGTTFTVVLPDIPFSAANMDDLLSTNRINPVSQFAGESLRVLLVDDVPVNIRVLQAMLRRLGVTNIVTAGNGAEALDALAKDASFNLVLTDMWMPVLDGEGLIREIRNKEQWKDLAVYVVTADVEAQKTYRESGFSGILLKPITLEKLRGVIG